jgi:hypothetical protein
MSERSGNLMEQRSYEGLSYDDARALVIAGKLPVDFDRWELADISGWTVAHMAALCGHLPANFDQWDLADTNDWTVAHSAAGKGGLPEGFDKYWMTTKSGITVAHTAACGGSLPADFSRWSMVGSQEVTVLRMLLRYSTKLGNEAAIDFLERIIKRWDKEKPLCETDADWEAFKQELPEVYYKYTINEVISNASCDGISNGAML